MSRCTVNMRNILHIYRIALLISFTSLQGIEVTSAQKGSSYFFYQQPEYPRDCKEAQDQCLSDKNSSVSSIKPDGYPHSFEVYCNHVISSGGWTVILRHIDGSLTFKRSWQDYKNGFGFLSSELWIGLNKLAYITNQAVYELRVDILLSDGSSFFVKYNSFPISDERSDYTIVSADLFSSNWSCIVSTCPVNMTRDTCTCNDLCTNPIRQEGCYTDCVETCLPLGCLVTETNSYISNGESFINMDCSKNCTCADNRLSCSADYACSRDATCTIKDEIRKCYCNEGFEGDGETCTSNVFTDCYEAYQAGQRVDGVYTVLPAGWTGSPFTVYCDMATAGGGWTVFQRRTDGVTNFYRGWNEYKQGFGSRDAGNDFWLGNDKIHYLTNQRGYKLRVDIVTSGGSQKYQEYASFQIGQESTKYRLTIGTSSGNAGDGFYNDNGASFSTRDQDNDECSHHHYAQRHRGAWWYNTIDNNWCTQCYYSYRYCYYFETRSNCNNIGTGANLNGEYGGGNGENIYWYYNNYCNLNSAEMKIRPNSI